MLDQLVNQRGRGCSGDNREANMRASPLFGSLIIVVLVTAAASAGEASEFITPAGFTSNRCLGDCNGDAAVSIDELLRGVRIALGESPRSICEAGGTGLFPLGISALTTAVLNALMGCVTERDLSNFSEFEWQESPALGFCPEIGSPASGRLSRVGTDYRLAIRLIALADPPPPGCEPPPVPLEGCFTIQPERCRLLTADEVARVHDAFAHVRVQTGPDAACLDLIIDPCVVKTARWDDTSFSDYPHTSDRLDDIETGRLEALLRSIASGPEVACP
jgi:hypothetical protein